MDRKEALKKRDTKQKAKIIIAKRGTKGKNHSSNPKIVNQKAVDSMD